MPENLVKRFEDRFNIKLPDNIDEYEDYGRFLSASNEDVLQPFYSADVDVRVISAWLTDALEVVIKDIKEKQHIPKQLTMDDILAREGFQKDQMDAEVYKKLVTTYKTLIELPIRDKIETDFSVSLADFTVREQVQFVNFLSSKTIEEVEEIKRFVQEYGQESIKVFLSLESDSNSGEIILELARRLPKEVTKKIFVKYNEVSSLLYENEKELNEGFFTEEQHINPFGEIASRAQNILGKAYQQTLVGTEVGVNDIEDQLDHIEKDTIQFTAMFKKASEEFGSLRFEDVKGVDFYSSSGTELDPEIARQARELYEKNYQGEENKAYKQMLISKFDRALQSDTSQFYILEYKGKFTGFIYFGEITTDKKGKKHRNAGGFNVDSSFENAKLGAAMYSQSMEEQTQDSVIHGHCNPEIPMTKKYIESGFIAIGVDEYEGKDRFEIMWDEELNKRLRSRNMSQQEIIDSAETKDTNLEIRVYDKDKSPDFSSISDNTMLTRYFTDKEAGKTYCVYESVV